jgi:nitroreductase
MQKCTSSRSSRVSATVAKGGLLLLLLVALSCAPVAAFAPPARLSRHAPAPVKSLWAVTLTAAQQHAKEVFAKFDRDSSGTISSGELGEMLMSLDIEATSEDADALFKYLDSNGDGEIDFDEFLPWYADAAGAAKQVASTFQSLLIGRRTVEQFDQTPVDDEVLKRAVTCAIAAPNRSQSEPWRFVQIGPKTVQKIAELKNNVMETIEGQEQMLDWTTIPGWCVVTTKLSPDDPDAELDDFKSTSCAVQNFMLSMWSEGIGTKWTSGPFQKTNEFAELCGVDTTTERVAGCIWYGFATGGLVNADPKRRELDVEDVLSTLP